MGRAAKARTAVAAGRTATPRQSEARAEQQAVAKELSTWRAGRIAASEKARVKAIRKHRRRKPDGSRGIDRVPKRLRGLSMTIEPAGHLVPMRPQSRKLSPLVNPARDLRGLRSGRLRLDRHDFKPGSRPRR